MSALQPQRNRLGLAVPRHLVHLDPLHLPSKAIDVLIVGGGVAGLSAALSAADAGRDVLVVLKGARGESATAWAQGGMAAAVHAEDSVALHGEDTARVGAGLSHPDVVQLVVEEAPALVERWCEWDARFDRDAGGAFSLALEGGHSSPRVLHAHGDQTGREIQRLLGVRASADDRITVHEDTFVLDLVTDSGRVTGALAWSRRAGYHVLWAGATIVTTGGAGQLWRETSNPPSATGDGLAMAYRAGARLRGLEFVQFHPTVLYVAGMARILVSEVARGEGGLLVDRKGHRFMPDYHPDAELAPRDVVSRAIVQQLSKVRDTQVFLDMRHLEREFLEARFPVITAACLEFDLDMAEDLIPVHPACHYLVGGIETDTEGATNLAGLFAAGECASSGLHGANRIASNSLLEGAVLGDRAGRHAAAEARKPVPARELEPREAPSLSGHLDVTDLDAALRSLMWRYVGIERDGPSLQAAAQRLAGWNDLVGRRVLGDPLGWVLTNKLQLGALVTAAALERTESRGTHARRDHPETHDDSWLRDLAWTRPQGDGA